MLSPTAATVRLFLHVLAATVWVGGQLTLAGLLPAIRALGPDAPRAVARRFNQVAWPAFGLLVVTGLWNIVAIDVTTTSSQYQVTFLVHLLAAAVSGAAAAVHAAGHSKLALALGGALGAAGALAALFLGVLLRSA